MGITGCLLFSTYVLRSLTSGKFYIGQTENLANRLWAHNAGLSPYTRNRGPWEMLYSEEFETRSEAMRREKFLKSGEGHKFLYEKFGKKG